MQFQVQELTKIIRTRVKIKDKNMKLFYKLLLNIKLWYIWCFHIKILNKPPIPISQCYKPAKTMLFDWMTPRKFLIFIIWFSQGETDQVSGFMLSSVVKFGKILLFRSTHFDFFFFIFVEICQEIEFISIITYVIILQSWKNHWNFYKLLFWNLIWA